MRGFCPASRTIWAKKADGGFVHAAKDRTPGAITAGHQQGFPEEVRSGPEVHSEEFHELSRTCFACSRLALKHYYTKQLRRTHKPLPLCGPMHSFSAPSPSKLVVSRSLLRCDRITYQRLCTDGGSNSMTGASEVDVVGIEEVQVRLQRRVQELQTDRVRVCSAQCVQRSMRRPSVSRVLPCMCDVSPSAARQERSRTKSRIC